MAKVCMVVLNSVWYDPRVRREATSSVLNGLETWVVGIKDDNFKVEKVAELPFITVLVEMDESYSRLGVSVFTKVKRTYLLHKGLIDKCIALRPDVIHANDLNALPAAYFAAKKSGCKIVYDSHEIFTENTSNCHGFMRRLIWKTIERFLIKRVDQVVSVSHAAAAELAAMYNIKKPMVVTNCAFKVDPSKLRLKAQDVFEILSHGKFYKGRGYEAFVRAAGKLKEYQEIKFVLRGYGRIEQELREIADAEGLDDKLRFDPPLDVTELVVAASSSHVGVAITEPVNKNFIYTVSNKLFEYLNAGLPVMLSDVPEHRYLNEKYNFGIILKENTPECIAQAVLQLYNDRELYENLSNNARKTVEVLNWDAEVQKLINVYLDLSAKK